MIKKAEWKKYNAWADAQPDCCAWFIVLMCKKSQIYSLLYFLEDFMGQKTLKSVRRSAEKKKKAIVTQYMRENWDVVLNSSVSMIKRLNFRTRLRFALEILFKAEKRPVRAFRSETTTTKPTVVNKVIAAKKSECSDSLGANKYE